MNSKYAIDKISDPKFYLENFCKIKTKEGGLKPFVLKECQKDLFNTINNCDRTMILKCRQLGFCLEEHTKILLSNLKWIELKDVSIGDSIISVDENKPGNGKQRKMRTAVVENKFNFKSNTLKITLDNGISLIGTYNHRMMAKKWECSTDVVWKKFSDMKIGTSIRYITKPYDQGNYEDGWFGGMLDGEGCLGIKRTGVDLNVSQVNGATWDRIVKYLSNNNYNFHHEIDKRRSDNSSKFGNKDVNKAVISRIDEIFRAICITRPARFIGNKWWEGKALPNNGWAKIVSIENYGLCNVIDLQTSEKTYIAEGFVSHNSTAVTGYFYHQTITNPGVNTALIGYDRELAAELLDKIKTFYRTTPPELRPTIQYNSKYEISFPKLDSKIIVLPSTENVGRGYTLHNVLVTELSAWEKAEEKMSVLEASVPIHGKIVIESTPRGQGNLYHRMWMTEDNGYAKKEYGWWWGYSQKEIDLIEKRMNDPMRFAQEYGLKFLASGRSVFDINVIEKQRENVLKIGDKVLLPNGREHTVYQTSGGLVIYKPPTADGMYACGADVAEGVEGGNYSAATFFDRKTGEEVAFYRGLIAPDLFGEKLDKWGRLFNKALMAVEINNHGLTTLTILKQKIYPSIYFRTGKIETLSMSTTDKMGWKTTKVTRPLLIDDLGQALRENVLTIHSKKTLDELSVFVYNDNGDMAPQAGFNDDTIFATGICLQAFKIMASGPLEQISYENHLPKSFAY